MPVFIASLHNELFKLRKRKKYTVLLIIASAVCVLSGLRGIVVNAISGMDFDRAALLGGLTLSHMTFFLQIFLPLMAIMAACDLFPVEFHDRTIRACLMRPVGRGKLYFSKVAAVFVLCVFDLAVLFAVTAVTQLVLGGTAEGIGTGLAACVLDLVPLAVLICFLCCLDQLLHGPSLAVLIGLVAYVGLLAVGLYVGGAGGMLFTGYLKWHNLWIGTALPLFAMLPRIGLLVGYGLVFACCGHLLFERREC